VVLFSVLVVCFFTFWICVVCLSFFCAVVFFLGVFGFYRRAFGDALPTVVLEGGSVGSADIKVVSVLDFLSVCSITEVCICD
jgi:hypothetical protein